MTVWDGRVVALVGLALLGCGGRSVQAGAEGGGGAPRAETGPLTFEAFCTAVARAVCEREGACCVSRGHTFSEARCEETVSVYSGGELPGSLAASCGFGEPAAYDPVRAGRCIDRVRSLTSGCEEPYVNGPGYLALLDDCATPQPKLPQAHEVCADECGAPHGEVSICVFGNDGYPNLCAAPVPYSRAGESCFDNVRLCAPGLICDFDAYRCHTPGADGAACPCEYCCASGNCDTTSGLCAPPLPLPEARCELLSDLANYELYSASLAHPRVAVSSRYVAWTEGTGYPVALKRAPKDGSGPIDLVTSSFNTATPFEIDDNYAYDLRARSNTTYVSRVALDTGAREEWLPLVAVPSGPRTFTLAGKQDGALLVVGGDCEFVERLDLATGVIDVPQQSLVPPTPSAGGYVAATLDGDTVYCAAGRGRAKFELNGAAAWLTTQALGDDPMSVAVVGRALFTLANNSFARFSLDTNAEETFAPPGTPPLVQSTDHELTLLLDHDRGLLHWMAQGIDTYEDRTGTFQTPPASSAYSLGIHLVQDDEFVYWCNGHAVFRRSKAELIIGGSD